MYEYCRKIYYLFLFVSRRVQINFIFPDNVRIMCLSCNVKKFKTVISWRSVLLVDETGVPGENHRNLYHGL